MESVYLVCFWVGLILTALLSLLGGLGHEWNHFHFGGHGIGHGGEIGHGHAGTGADGSSGPSPMNMYSVLAFLTGFGGIGYVLTTSGMFGGIAILLVAAFIGIALAWFMFMVMIKLFMRGERVMRLEDYDLVGVLGYVSISIPEKGVGEVKYLMAETTRSIGARSDSGHQILKGTEVVMVRVEKGLAIVVEYERYVHDDVTQNS